jgi:hypothetical protein
VVGERQIVIEGTRIRNNGFNNFFQYVQNMPPSVLTGAPHLDGDVESKTNAAVGSLRYSAQPTGMLQQLIL